MPQPKPRLTSAALAGAVDLSALRAPAPTPASTPAGDNGSAGGNGSAGTQATSASPYIVDVTEATFQTEVLERSLRTPVVIDFWAEWCGPCKQLSPVLEKLAIEGQGAWTLAKIDVDADQRLAAAFRVQSIPFVVALVGGQPIDAFPGAIPEAQLRQWIAAVLDAAGATGPDGPAEPALDPRLLEAEDKMQAGDLDGAEAGFTAYLAEVPNDPIATSGLAQVRLMRRLEGLDGQAALREADARADDVAAQTRAADVEFVSGLADRAFARLVGLVRRSSGDDRDAARSHLLSLFAIAAPDDPVVAKARRDLANALF